MARLSHIHKSQNTIHMYDSIIESLPIIRGLRRPRINKHTKKGSEIFNKFTRLGMLYSLYLTFTHVYDECGSQK
jgi:hypothetical protein